MSNKRQLKMSASNRVTFILCCDLKRVLGLNFVSILLLLVTSTTLIVESAKLETGNIAKAFTTTQQPIKSATETTTIKIATNDNDNHQQWQSYHQQYHHQRNHNDNADEALILRQQHKEHTLDEAAENFYHSELQRLSYDTIHSILRDENEPIFRGEDNDRRFYHAKSLQPTHEIMKREAEFSTTTTHTTNETKNATTTTAPKSDKNHLKLKQNVVELNLSSKSLKTFNITAAYENITTLNLTNNQLEELPITQNAKTVLIDLNSNHIQKAVAPLNKNLRALFLSGNQIENLAALNLSQLVALETLDLSCNRIQNLETSFFPQLMHNLKYLNLANNHLGSISRETFYNLLSLNTLLLAHNDITNIDYETFLSLPNLQYLDLSHNQLKGESIRALQGIPDLIGLSIAYNPDMGESLQEFVASWSLKEVDASGTGLCQIPAALAQAVRTLKLADNWLKIINCGDLDSYPLLTYLDLSNSHIEDIEDDAMGRLEFLELLFLDHNLLRKVPVSLPTSLEHLFLQNNEIMDLQVQAFQGLKNLKTLDVSHNKLLYLPALPLPKLLTLNLQASGLQGLNQAIVHTLPHLRDLLLEENPIKCSDLLGIAEWASPCRIAERVAMGGGGVGINVAGTAVTKSIDGEQIANAADLGQKLQQQQQLQTVAKIDLKAKFVQTHNFYEKFVKTGTCNFRQTIAALEIIFTTMQPPTPTLSQPPTCAIEFEDEIVLKVEKPTVLTASILATEQTNVNFNEQHKLALVEKSAKATTKEPATNTVTSKSKGITENANHGANTAKIQATKTFQTKNVVIANVTSLKNSADVAEVGAVMPTTVSTVNLREKTQMKQTTAEPTTSLTASTSPTTSATMATTLNKSSEIVATKLPNSSLLPLPETMTTKLTAKMPAKISTNIPTSSSTAILTTKPNAFATSLSSSLLERQRRLEATTLGTLLTTPTITPAPTDKPVTYQAKNLARSIGSNDSQTILQQRKSPNNFENLNGEIENKTVRIFSKILPITTSSPTTKTAATTTLGPQHKHVILQLNSKDRHLIGTPLLTHHGQNLMIAAEELKKNGNHITAKTVATTAATNLTNSTAIAIPQKWTLDKGQNQQTEKEVNKFSKLLDAENVATTTVIATTINAPTSNIKFNKKLFNEQKKKPTTLIMKKMTITTTATKQQQQQFQSTSTISSNHMEENINKASHQQHHHYNLNTPRENEATASIAFGNLVTSTNIEQPSQQYKSYNVKHHSTVNTPVINGHEINPQTFQEHNEIEEAAAAVAARASISSKFNSKLHGHDHGWSSAVQQKTRLHFDNPTVVFIVGIVLFVTLVISLLHAYRCKMPTILSIQRQHQLQHQRPHRQQREQQGQQMRIRNKYSADADDDEVKSHSSFLNGGSNQFQRQWRLERTCNQQQQQQQHQTSSSPFHNLEVRDLQQTSAIEPCPRYCKPTYNISNALGERSNSHTSSSCSPHSSCTFDDETCYIEMTTDVGQPIAGAGSTTAIISHSDLLPMELLSVKRRDLNEVNNARQHQLATSITTPTTTLTPTKSHQTIHSHAFQTSTIDESSLDDVVGPAHQDVSNTKLTPRTRKLGLW